MIHRDLKPANILLLKKDNISSIRICDFGLANRVGTGLFDQNYENVGTIMYQAPEQMDEDHSYGKAADIWAAGMIIYEMISKGGHPILGKDIHNNTRMTVEKYRVKMSQKEIKFKMSKKLKNTFKLAKNLVKNL